MAACRSILKGERNHEGIYLHDKLGGFWPVVSVAERSTTTGEWAHTVQSPPERRRERRRTIEPLCSGRAPTSRARLTVATEAVPSLPWIT